MPSLSTSDAGAVFSHVSAAHSAASTCFRGCCGATVCQSVLPCLHLDHIVLPHPHAAGLRCLHDIPLSLYL